MTTATFSIGRMLPANPRVRVPILVAGLLVLAAVFTQVLLPGGGTGTRGTPTAVLFSGLVSGLATALTAAGIVLIYRTTRVINFAQSAIGAAGAIFAFDLLRYTAVPFWVAFPLGIAVATACGLLFDLVFGRRFFNAPRLVLTVVTIAAAGFLVSSSQEFIQRLPFFPPVDSPDRLRPFGAEEVRGELPLSDFVFHVGALEVPFHFAEVFAIVVTVVALVALGLFLRFSRMGIAVRAMAENAERATLLGVSVGLLSSVVWGVSGALSGISAMLTGIVSDPRAVTGIAPTLLLPAMAAAVLGRMRNIGTTAIAAVTISMVSAASRWSFRNDGALIEVALLLVVCIGLLLQRQSLVRSGDESVGTWAAVQEQRPIPKELSGVTGLRVARNAAIAVAAIGLVLYPFLVGTSYVNLGTVTVISAIVALSLVILTGWSGQVSLGQYGFVAVGAVVGGSLIGRHGVPFLLAVPITVVVVAAFAALIGLPALRMRGLFLGITTFAFAAAVPVVLFNDRYFGWLLPDSVARPKLLLWSLDNERTMFYVCLGTLVLAVGMVLNLRRSRLGRLLIGLRDNEAEIRTIGLSATRLKLIAFALSGGLAGLAGVLFAVQQRGLSSDAFSAEASINIFLLAVIGGVSSVGGAMLGALYFNLTHYFISSTIVTALLGSGGVLYLLYAAPGGLISIYTRARDGVLRIIAQRRQIVVPSLFADFDPNALARRLAPLGKAADRTGLASLRPDQRWSRRSYLYGKHKWAADSTASPESDLMDTARSLEPTS